jgi:glutamate synthase domain-containing protein 2
MLDRLNALYPVRYTALALCVLCALLSLFTLVGFGIGGFWFLVFTGLAALGFWDLRQTRSAVLRNYPVIGHLRFMLEKIRPEIRQYFLESDTEATPFSRSQRSLAYARAKDETDKRPFGTQRDLKADGHEWINHSLAPTHIASHDFRITIGGPACTQPYEASVFNISAMSFGALSANAIQALNRGAKQGRFAHDTGEGSISSWHRLNGGDLIWEIGSGYFGCRDEQGRFNDDRFKANALDPQVKMIELKLSQGAKPGHGGVLPGPKVTPEIAAARGVPVGQDCVSPAAHSAFSSPIEMLRFIAHLRELSGGKPPGFKLCIGHPWEWFAIVKAMLATGITPDFIVVDGAEGGTGAAPLEFTDHVGAPLQEGLRLVHNTLVGVNLRDRIKVGASGKVVSAFDIARAMVQPRARFHVRAGLHPGPELPHRPLPDRRHHPGPAASAGPGRARQGHARVPLPPEHAQGAAGTGAGRRAAAPGGDQRPPHRAPCRSERGTAAGEPAADHHTGGVAGRPAGSAPCLHHLLAPGERRAVRADLNPCGLQRQSFFPTHHRRTPCPRS